MSFWRRTLPLCFVVVVSTFAAFVFTAQPAHAAPGVYCPYFPIVYNRPQCYGYFTGVNISRVNSRTGQIQVFGDNVITNGGAGLFPAVDINSFVNLISSKLYGGNSDDATGAAFIVDTMLGRWGSDYGSVPAGIGDAQGSFGLWLNLVRAYDSGLNGRSVNWNQFINFTPPFENSLLSSWNARDDAFYYEQSPDAQWTIVFRNPDGSTFMIKKNCGNLVGIPSPLWFSSYQLTGRTTVSVPQAQRGTTVTFSNFIHNTGPDTAASVLWHERDAANNNIIAQNTNNISPGDTDMYDERYDIPNTAPIGSLICRYIDFAPAQNNQGSGAGAPACVRVQGDYSLTPTVTPSATTAQVNDTITFTYSVSSTGTTPSDPINCTITGNTRPPGYIPLPQQDNVTRTSDPGYVPPPTSCPTVFNPSVPPTTIATETVTVGNVNPGQRICRSLTVAPKDQFGGSRSSAEGCVVIAKTPYVYFSGNDVWAGGGLAVAGLNPPCNSPAKIETVAHQLATAVAGSRVEYGAFALNAIQNFGSAGKALINPGGLDGWLLSFSNLVHTNLGFYGAPQHCVNTFDSQVPATAPNLGGSTIDVGAQGSGVWHLTGSRSFRGSIPRGAQQIYLVDGDVTITSDMPYPASYNSLADIPSLVVITKGNMIVQSGVRQMDGIFAAQGTFHTCDAIGVPLDLNTCNNQLTVNGAVVANTVDLLRTAGADGPDDNARRQPAEVFNFNPELYLRNALSGSNLNNGVMVWTIDQKDLPPRY